MEELQDFTEEKESNFDLKAEIFKYLAYWKWLLLGFLLGGLLAFLYNRYTIPKYYTESSLMILNENENNIAGALPSGGGILQLKDNTLDNQIVSLRSKRLVEKVVREMNHNISYYIEGNIITTEAYKSSPILIEFITPDSIIHKTSKTFFVTPLSDTEFELVDEQKNYQKNHRIGEIISHDNLQFSIVPRRSSEESSTFSRTRTVQINIVPVDRMATFYNSTLTIGPKGKAADILSLGIVQPDGRKSEDFLNNLMFQFNEDGVADKRQVAYNTTEFIQERLELITQELDSVEGGMADFKRENQFMDVASGAQ